MICNLDVSTVDFNPLNAELNPICHLLVLLGDLTFMGPCIVSIFQYISNKMHRYTVYLYLETALHVSVGNSTYHQEGIQLYLQHLEFVTPLLLSAAIVEELEPVRVCCGQHFVVDILCCIHIFCPQKNTQRHAVLSWYMYSGGSPSFNSCYVCTVMRIPIVMRHNKTR
jgi:hypothetical protein